MSKKPDPRDIEAETRLNRSVIAPQGARRFGRDRDPLDAWMEIAMAAPDEPLPKAVREYLRAAAKRIVAIVGSAKGGTNRAVAQALGVEATRGGSRFERLDRIAHDFMIAAEVWIADLNQPPDSKLQATFEVAAAAHVAHCSRCKRLSWKRVQACWYSHARDVIPQHLQDEFAGMKPAEILRATRRRRA